jgi:hypothetical protein
VLAAAAVCPAPPLLARALTGAEQAVPELRQACADAVTALLEAGPDLVAVVGTAAEGGERDTRAQLDLSAFAPQLGGPPPGARLPVSLGLGAMLLDFEGYRGRRLLHAVTQDDSAAHCAELGARLAAAGERVALLVMADGSARRTLRAPGYLDERSGPFDTAAERAIRDGDPGALLAIDAGLARDLMATGRPGWQVLAGAMNGRRAASEIRYSGDPFGVFYLVASLAFGRDGRPG